MFLIPVSLLVLSAPLSGWLADTKFGNYKVFRVSAVLLFIATVINCLLQIVNALVLVNNHVLMWIHVCFGGSLFVVSGSACVVTALPLGLDQMPDASSSNITSYIAWFVCIIYIGNFITEGLNILFYKCEMQSSFTLAQSLFLAICMSIVLTSDFIFSSKWMIVEPESPQSLKTIYRVLKFAAKHKAPLNRSALTYWEEDIPSRIDLGKSKYGGPFTTEQVEDVKTILRFLAVYLPIFLVVSSSYIRIDTICSPQAGETFPGVTLTSCPLRVLSCFVSFYSLYGILGTVCYEFLFYPLIERKIPQSTILRRIGNASLVITLISFICFIIKLTRYLLHSDEIVTKWIVHFLYHITSGVLSQVFLTSVLEFVCAQAPYNMRGLMVSLYLPLILFSDISGWICFALMQRVCIQTWCPLLLFSGKILICFIGFILFCIVACWYKMRVRDEDYSAQRVVEEVYDRYLTAAAAYSRSYVASRLGRRDGERHTLPSPPPAAGLEAGYNS